MPCPKADAFYMGHSWVGERVEGTVFYMWCRRCGVTVLHDMSGRKKHGSR